MSLMKRTIFLFFVLFSQTVFAQTQVGSDSLLAAAIQKEFLSDNRLNAADLSIRVIQGKARLRGVVASLAQKRWAEQTVSNIAGVRTVKNEIWVKTGEISDKRLEKSVQEKLANYPLKNFDYSRVKVLIIGGKAVLKGEVSSWGQRHQAEEIVANAPGVNAIRNKLKIRDGENKNDPLIERAVLLALREKIQMDRGYKINIRSIGGKVTLKGAVRNRQDKDAAVRTALFVPGVADVVDKLRIALD